MSKKSFMYLMAIMMVAMLSFSFSSCSSDDDDGVGGDITGSWYVPYDVEGDMAIAFLTFSTDGFCTTEEYILFPDYGWKLDNQESVPYVVNGNKLTMTIEGTTGDIPFSIKGDKLILYGARTVTGYRLTTSKKAVMEKYQ